MEVEIRRWGWGSGGFDGKWAVGTAEGFGDEPGEPGGGGFVVEHGAGGKVAALVSGQALGIQGDLDGDGFVVRGGFHFRIDGGGWVWETSRL